MQVSVSLVSSLSSLINIIIFIVEYHHDIFRPVWKRRYVKDGGDITSDLLYLILIRVFSAINLKDVWL